LREAFLLDRAGLVLEPDGLAAVGQPSVEFARDVFRTIRTAAETDRPRVLPIRVDPGVPGGLWDATAPVRQQLRSASQLHSVTGSGRLDLPRPADVQEMSAQMRAAAESSVARLRFVAPAN
jgi:hypothetical protein